MVTVVPLTTAVLSVFQPHRGICMVIDGVARLQQGVGRVADAVAQGIAAGTARAGVAHVDDRQAIGVRRIGGRQQVRNVVHPVDLCVQPVDPRDVRLRDGVQVAVAEADVRGDGGQGGGGQAARPDVVDQLLPLGVGPGRRVESNLARRIVVGGIGFRRVGVGQQRQCAGEQQNAQQDDDSGMDALVEKRYEHECLLALSSAATSRTCCRRFLAVLAVAEVAVDVRIKSVAHGWTEPSQKTGLQPDG